MENNILPYLAIGSAIVAILSGIIAISTFFIGAIPARKLAKLQAVIQYFNQADTRDFIDRRERLSKSDKKEIDEKDARFICSFFHKWGLIAKHKLLPM